MSEKLELVRSWNELKAGIIVVLKPCGRCNGAHRMILTRLIKGARGAGPSGIVGVSDTWLAEPGGHDAALPYGVPRFAVEELKAVYRVVDPDQQRIDERADAEDRRDYFKAQIRATTAGGEPARRAKEEREKAR